MIKKYLYQLLPSIIILGIFFVFFYSPSNKVGREKVQELNILNKRLKKTNDSIYLEIQKYKSDMTKSDEIIETLMEEEGMLREEIETLNIKITKIKGKYEKANNHANSFDSAAIRQYFSNL